MLFLLFSIAFLTLVDIYTTHKILSKGGRELNPLVNFIIEKFGLNVGLWVRVPFQIALMAYLYSVGFWELFAFTCVYSLAMVNNLYHMYKIKRNK